MVPLTVYGIQLSLQGCVNQNVLGRDGHGPSGKEAQEPKEAQEVSKEVQEVSKEVLRGTQGHPKKPRRCPGGPGRPQGIYWQGKVQGGEISSRFCCSTFSMS